MIGEGTTTSSQRYWGLARRLVGLAVLMVLITGLVYGAAGERSYIEENEELIDPPAAAPTIGGQALFASWPQGVKPDAVIILSGETYGFLQPCGCSRPQKGGLERRANFIAGLKAQGWPVAGVDLGDLYPPKGAVTEQSLLKYATAMEALRDMGYVAIGLGKTELAFDIHQVLAAYSQQKVQPPFVLAGNIVGMANGKEIPRAVAFQGGNPGGSAIQLTQVAGVGKVPIGVAGVVGSALSVELAPPPPAPPGKIGFKTNGKPDETLKIAVQEFAASPLKPQLNILLYQGTENEARLLAKDWPQFEVILCQASDAEPPLFPIFVNHKDGRKTSIIQVGHKGQYVGVLGIFNKDGGGHELRYQLVPLGEEYITPKDPVAEKANLVLPLMDWYAARVKGRNYLKDYPQVPHSDQIRNPNANLSYVGSDSCKGCHAAEFAKWQTTHHSHALTTLEQKATRPGLRNFDGECIVCHTVGFEYRTGFRNTTATPNLMHVGCESCHGPGSGHSADPKAQVFLAQMSPWKSSPQDKLPDVGTMEKIAVISAIDRGKIAIPPAQMQVFNKVERTCMKCHNDENDPHFDLYKFWPKIAHTGLAAGGLPPPGGPVVKPAKP